MPSCFQLLPKEDDSSKGKVKGEAYGLSNIDEEICHLLDRPVHPKQYCIGWFDAIGYLIATNSNMELGSENLRNKLKEWECTDDMFIILDYLERNYTSTSFYSHK